MIPGLLPLLPFAEGRSEELVGEAFRVLDAVPGAKGAELQAALATFSDQIFPGQDWFARIDKEKLMQSAVFNELMAERVKKERVSLIAPVLEIRLGKSKRTEAIVARLPLCTKTALEKILKLLVSSKKKADVLAAIERLVPKA